MPKYMKTLSTPNPALFDTFMIDVSGLLPITKNCVQCLRVVVEQLNKLSLTKPVLVYTNDYVLRFDGEDVIQNFGYYKVVLFYSRTSFTCTKLKSGTNFKSRQCRRRE